MQWVTLLNKTHAETGRMLRLQYLKRVGDSVAESRHRVMLNSKEVYRGWAQDSYEEYDKS